MPVLHQPWTQAYVDAHRLLVAGALDDPSLLRAVAAGAQLPDGWGVGFDERVCEYPWLFAQGFSGRVLDAGSVLNHRHVLDRVLPEVDELTVTTLEPEDASWPERRVSYVYADLRELPFRDNWFDRAVCVSTLEHVGMDNRIYGVHEGAVADPEREVAKVLSELRRVVRPGGAIAITVPFGRRQDLGWMRTFDAAALDRLIADLDLTDVGEAIFRYTPTGWRRGPRELAGDARYRDAVADPRPVADHAAAARAVACLAVRV